MSDYGVNHLNITLTQQLLYIATTKPMQLLQHTKETKKRKKQTIQNKFKDKHDSS